MKFNFEATGIGSVPFIDPVEGCKIIRNNFTSIPFWPQLPKRTFHENMYVQYSSRLPGATLNEANKTIHIKLDDAFAQIEEIYGKCIEGDLDYFAIPEGYAAGFYEFMSRKDLLSSNLKAVKGHITGPISYGLFLTDENKRSIIHEKDIFEVMTKVLAMNAKWQIAKLKTIQPNVIIFIDEPYFVSIGSSYVNINVTQAMERLDEVIAAIHESGALAGIHCCGNTDWPLLLKRDIDIINFDAYNFMKEFMLFGSDVQDYLRRGKSIAWGIIPSSDEIATISIPNLTAKIREQIKGSPSSIVTPSCGLGSLDEKTAQTIIKSVLEISTKLKEL